MSLQLCLDFSMRTPKKPDGRHTRLIKMFKREKDARRLDGRALRFNHKKNCWEVNHARNLQEFRMINVHLARCYASMGFPIRVKGLLCE